MTFSKDIAPIVFEHCASCHRPGQLAPFSLITYAEVRNRAARIADVTAAREMPPWLPESGYAEFSNARRLRTDQLEILQAWATGGAIEGDPSDLPSLPTWSAGWQLGTPDLVVRLSKPYRLRPASSDIFRNFVIPIPLSATRYVRGVEFQPGSSAVVHHAVIGIDRTGTSRRLDEEDPEPGYDGMLSEAFQSPDGHFIGWTPGKAPLMEAPDMAWRLERGSDLVLQMHLLPASAPVALQPQIGLFFTETPPTRVPFMVKLTSTTIDIPPGEKNYSVSDSYVLPVDVEALSVYPHAHYLGKEMKGLARLPDGTTKWLIWIKNWDFSWQDVYRYRSPVVLPRGTTISMQYTYDNSTDNPHNANHPPRRVVYGPHSSDEMGDLWLQVVPRNPADARILARDSIQRQVMAAIAGAEKMVAAAPNDAGRRNFLGADYLQAGRTEEAAAELDVALRLRPDYGEAHNNLGSALLSLGKLTEATRHFRQALRSRPHDDRVHFNLGNALKAAGQLDEAVREFGRALQINPDSAEAHNNLGVVLGSRNRLTDAIWHFEQAIAVSPDYAEAHNNLAIAAGAEGKFDDAIRHARLALEINPDFAEAQSNLGLLLKSKDSSASRR